MDNRNFDMSLEGKKDFDLAMSIAFGRHEAIGYSIKDGKLILYWTKHPDMVELPYSMKVEDAIPFCWGWLEKNPPKRPAPDHDGDNEQGFRISCDYWGHAAKTYHAFLEIEPIWAMYGK